MTGAELLAYVKRTFKRTDKDTEIYEAMTDVIADVRLRINSEEYKEEAYNDSISALGEYRIELPSDFGHIIGDVTLIDDASNENRILRKISKQSYDELYGERLYDNTDNIDTGVPRHFCIYSKQLYVGAVPDKTTYKYFLNYTTEDFAEITSTTSNVPFSERYRRMLRRGVLAELYEGLDQAEEAEYQRGLFISDVSLLATNDKRNIQDYQNVCYNGI